MLFVLYKACTDQLLDLSLRFCEPYAHSELVTREVLSHSRAGGHEDVQIPCRWDKSVTEFHDIFDPPGMPVDRDTVHHIELLPNVEPHYRH